MFTIALSAASSVVTNRYGPELSGIPYEVFWVGGGMNVPTFVNFAQIFIANFMSFDEATRVHENVGPYLALGLEMLSC